MTFTESESGTYTADIVSDAADDAAAGGSVASDEKNSTETSEPAGNQTIEKVNLKGNNPTCINSFSRNRCTGRLNSAGAGQR